MLIEVEINIDLETSEWTKETLLQVLSSQLHNIDLLEEGAPLPDDILKQYEHLYEDEEDE